MIAVVLALQTALWLTICFVFARGRIASPFHPLTFYLAFHGIVFVVRPILVYTFHFERVFFYMWFYPTNDQAIFALTLSSVGLIAFTAFSWIGDTTPPDWDRSIEPGLTKPEWVAYVMLAMTTGPIALYSAYLNVGTTLGGADLVHLDRDPLTGNAVLTNTTGYLTAAELALLPLCLLLIWGGRFRLWSFIPYLVYLAYHLYVGWERWTIILSLSMLMLLYLTWKGKRAIPLSFLALLIPVYFVFHLLGENRDYFKAFFEGQPVEETGRNAGQSWSDMLDGQEFANFDYLTYVIDVVPEKSDTYSYFTQYLQIFTEPIPRILWPEKPIGPPINLVNLNDYGNFVGLTVSLVGDGWISAGWLGVLVTLGVAGFLLARIHHAYWRGEATTYKIFLYCTLLPLSLQWFRDGGISIVKFVTFTTGWVVLWQGFVVLLHVLRIIPQAQHTVSTDH